MNGKELLEAMSFVDEALVAQSNRSPSRRIRRQLAALAACLCLVVLGGIVLKQLVPLGGSKDALSEEARMETTMAQSPAEAPAAPAEPDAAAPAAPEAAGGGSLCIQVLVEARTEAGYRVRILEDNGPFSRDQVITVTLSCRCLLEAGSRYTLEIASFDQETDLAQAVCAEPLPEEE